jgi:hypothetical protein
MRTANRLILNSPAQEQLEGALVKLNMDILKKRMIHPLTAYVGPIKGSAVIKAVQILADDLQQFYQQETSLS